MASGNAPSVKTEEVTSRKSSTSWKPLGLRPFFLTTVAVVTTGLFAVLAFLLFYSIKNDGLLKVEDKQSVSSAIFFAYNYLPVIIVVAYTFLWESVDSDARRFQPYPELSRPEGVSGTALFYEYSYEYTFLVPLLAARKKHWTVFLGSVAFLLSSLVLNSLSSSVIGIKSITVFKAVNLHNWTIPTVPFAKQSDVLTGESINYMSSILSQRAFLPAFTTRRYSIAPFASSLKSELSSNATLTAESTAYWSELQCRRIVLKTCQWQTTTSKVDPSTGTNITHFLVDALNATYPGTDCMLQDGPIFDFPKSGQPEDSVHTGGVSGPVTGLTLQTPYTGAISPIAANCTPSRWHWATFMRAIPFPNVTDPVKADAHSGCLSQRPRFDIDLRVFACEAQYFAGKAQVRVHANNGTVIWLNETELQQRKTSMDSNLFDMELFESEMGTARPPTDNQNKIPASRFDIPPMTSLAEIAVNLAPNSSALFDGDDSKLLDALDGTYRTAFVVAQRSTSDETAAEPSGNINGKLVLPAVAVVVSLPFAIASLSVLLVLTCVALTLLRICRRIETVLKRDPESISATLSLIADGNGDNRRFGPLQTIIHTQTTKEIEKLAAPCTYRLRHSEDLNNDSHACIFEVCGGNITAKEVNKPDDNSILSTATGIDPLPTLFTWIGGLSFIALFVLGMVLLGILYALGQRSGYAFRADDGFLSSLLYSFTPTLIASLLSISWGSVHRDLCVLEPFVRLRQGNTRAKDTISLSYASKPPIASLIPALRSRHIVIAVAATTALSTSILQISMASLFSLSLSQKTSTSISAVQPYAPSIKKPYWPANFQTTEAIDALNYVRANLTDGTSLPPWTTTEYSFIPVNISHGDGDATAVYQARTTGIKAGLQCRPLGLENITYSPSTVKGSAQIGMEGEITTILLNDTIKNCVLQRSVWPGAPSEITQSMVMGYVAEFSIYQDGASLWPCARSTAVFFETGGPAALYGPDNLTSVACAPQVAVRDYWVQFDTAGNILHSEEIPNTDQTGTIFQTGWKDFMGSFHVEYAKSGISGGVRWNWAGLLMARYRDARYPNPRDRNIDTLVEAATHVYSSTFAISISQSRDLVFEKREKPAEISVVKSFNQPRQVPSLPMFGISIALFALYLVAFTAVLIRRRFGYAPRLPKSLGAIITYCFASNMLEDFVGTHDMNSKERDQQLDAKGRRYGFGWFQGSDGKLHQGIEREPLLKDVMDG